jgi:hypothetical protein
MSLAERCSLVLVLCATSGCGGFGQDRFERGAGDLTGVVFGTDGLPAAARVGAIGLDGKIVSRVVTRADGRFGLSSVPVGKLRVAAFDAQGNFATVDAVAIGGEKRDVGSLTLSAVDLSDAFVFAMGFEQRLTSKRKVVEAFTSRSGRTFLWKTSDDAWWMSLRFDTEALAPSPMSLPPGVVSGIDDQFIWGNDGIALWRQRLSNSAIERQTLASIGSLECLGISMRGLLCWDLTDADIFLERKMPGRLFLWANDAVSPVILQDRLPDGVDALAVSADGRSIAFAVRPFGGRTSGDSTRLSLPTLERRSATGEPVAGHAFAPDGRLASVRLSPAGVATLHVEGVIVDTWVGDGVSSVSGFGYDVALARWVIRIVRGSNAPQWVGVSLKEGSASPLGFEPPSLDWRTSDDGTSIVFARAEQGFTQLFATRGGRTEMATYLGADHRPVGVSGSGGELFYTTRDPLTGVDQLFAALLSSGP